MGHNKPNRHQKWSDNALFLKAFSVSLATLLVEKSPAGLSFVCVLFRASLDCGDFVRRKILQVINLP